MTDHEPLSFTDVHCHLLPGIDDGSPDWDTTLAMARVAVEAQTRTVIATPHQLDCYEGNTSRRIRELVAEARRRLADADIPLTVLPGADVRVHEDLPELVRRGEVLTLADRGGHVLLELPHDQVLPLGNLIYRLQAVGVSAILSHPERNSALLSDPEQVRPWVMQGCLLQVTAGSITGEFGREAQRVSRWLLREGLVHLVASDAHDPTHRPPTLVPAYEQVCRWADPEVARRLFVTNPEAVALGRPLDAPLPLAASRTGIRGWWKKVKVTLCGV